MSDNNVSSIAEKRKDIDLAAMVAADKKERADKCLEIVNAAMKEYNCVINIFIHIGEHKVPLGAIVSAPIEISIEPQ